MRIQTHHDKIVKKGLDPPLCVCVCVGGGGGVRSLARIFPPALPRKSSGIAQHLAEYDQLKNSGLWIQTSCTAHLGQKESTLESDISRKLAKCGCHVK